MAKNNIWMSVSDLMTGLMIIFMFITVAYIKRVQSNQSILNQYIENKTTLHDKMAAEFRPESDKGQITITGDLSMRFENAETLFPSGDFHLTSEYKNILSDILPRYLNILLNDSMRDRIREIRVEGHTDDVPVPMYDSDPYIANLILSQKRSVEVMRFIRKMPEYENYSEEQKQLLEYWFTANGLSYGKALDEDGQYTLKSGKPISRDKSRRVEFRIITSGDDVIKNFIEKNK